MNCEFLEPVNLEPDPEQPAQWFYSKMSCSTETLELIQSASTEANFYLDKKVSYGDVLTLVFISIFIIGVICKWIAVFIFKD